MTNITCTKHGHSKVEPTFMDCPWCLESTIARLTAEIAALQQRLDARRPTNCKCDFRTYVLGDGCEVCSPAKALEYAKETIQDQAEAIAAKDEALRMAAMALEKWGICHCEVRPHWVKKKPVLCQRCAVLTACREALGEQP